MPKRIIYVSDIPWNDLTQRQQQISLKLADYTEVTYFSCNSLTNLRKYSGKVKTEKEKLLIQELFLFPYTRFWLIKQLNYLIAFCFLYILLILKKSKPVFILSHPSQYRFVNLPNSGIFYDFLDDTSGFPKVKKISALLKENEEKIIEKTEKIFTSSRYFSEKLKGRFPEKVVFVPNGVNLPDFSQSLSEKPKELCYLSEPIIGFYGAISDWVDLDLLQYLLKEKKELNIVMIGPVDTDISRFKEYKRIHFLGKKPYRELQKYLSFIDIWIIPFCQNEFTETVNPVKAYEYLAAGKKVVSTYLPELEPFKSAIWITKTREEFLEKIELCQKKQEKSDTADLQKMLQEYSWPKLAGKIYAEICQT